MTDRPCHITEKTEVVLPYLFYQDANTYLALFFEGQIY